MIEDDLRAFISEREQWSGPRGELTDDYPLIESDLIDSLGIFQVVSFVEQHFGVEVVDEELIPENFGTISGMARLVRSKLEPTSGADMARESARSE